MVAVEVVEDFSGGMAMEVIIFVGIAEVDEEDVAFCILEINHCLSLAGFFDYYKRYMHWLVGGDLLKWI